MTDPLFDPAPPRRGEPWIDQPGWYDDISDVDYHLDPVVGGSMSSTGARTLATKTPAHYDWDRRHGRPDSKTLDWGKVAHARVLGRGTEVAVIVGTGKDRNAWRTDADKAAVAKAKAAGKTPIKYADHQQIEEMARRLRAHPTAGKLLARTGRHEQVGVWQDQATGVWCRVMADFLPDVPEGARRLVVDYKTTASADPAEFAKSVANYGYDQQADWYCDGVQALDPRDEPPQFVLIAQEKTPPYGVLVAYLDELALERGRVRNARARALYRRCTESGEWPGYPVAPVALSLPGWAARTAEDEITAAESGTPDDQEVTPA
ncbi:PD-(D/E)XK nuclease-like domain-containing protein [Pseudonocardia alni]|uniref:PD-(D/E)XK nuclease-like domain-containing protein n=1 Tax=Pseudonocardia alni TaxID=33907 RepID=UPI0027A1FB4A|nr:hypothetical protein PaSha_14175 [Pseudonocardia alni]